MRKLSIIILALAAPLAQAADEAAAKPQPGDETRAWVQLQTSGAASVATPPSTEGEVAEHVYQRYLKSFDHPIPLYLPRQSFVSGGGQ